MSECAVVAFHGEVVPGRSPGLHGPVVVDASGHMLRGNGEVDPEVFISDASPLPGEGTRIGPWLHTPGEIVITVDRPLLRAARALARQREITGPVMDVLDAENRDGEALRMHRAERLAATPTVVAWYASRANVDALRTLLRDLALDELRHAIERGEEVSIRKCAWQLQRAATKPDDDFLAIAALQRSGFGKVDVRELIEDLVKDLPARTRAARFKNAVAMVDEWQRAKAESAGGRARALVRALPSSAARR